MRRSGKHEGVNPASWDDSPISWDGHSEVSLSERVWQETGNVRLYLDALKDELTKSKSSTHQIIKKTRHKGASKKERALERERRSTPKPVAVELRFQRASAFLAFITIVESKGLPARIIDEDKLASIAAGRQWDQIPLVLAHLIRDDEEVKVAFQAFENAGAAPRI